ncbi:hypothetical protein B0T18DRAFT_486430 [Schizothecium vesticola]|uniref:Uncharacterized protein n=1 Tax=Schizothecium vesticola TaxID=314040 RepID=A0AA40F6I4_9PEZI|nr:hypothetical protein B0T18DRAFT_486430 [Schizothecium vesticola]
MSSFVPPGWAPTLKPHERDMYSLYREREAQRAAATRQEIEGDGIHVDEQGDIQEADDDSFACPPFKKLKLDPRGSHVRKWKMYTYEEFVAENRDRFVEEVEIEKEYQARFGRHYLKVVAELGASKFDHSLLSRFFDEANINVRKIDMAATKWDKMLAAADKKKAPQGRKLDFISSLSTMPELVVALGKHLTPREILTLYSISREFKYTLDHNMQSCIIQWGRHMVGLPGMRMCMLRPYETLFIHDPLRRTRLQLSMAHITHPERPPPQPTGNEMVRPVPSLRWLQMVVHREIRLRDIVAVLARNGHRLPPGALQSLRKLWMIMDIPTSRGRTWMMQNQMIQPRDLIHMQMFFVKLQMLFNDPVYGPKSSMLLKLMLGQRSLSTLWAMLRRKQYTTEREIIQLKLRYDVSPTHLQLVHGLPVHGVPLLAMGMIQFEGWGKGIDHLIRPDQLVALEAARRQLGISFGIRDMMRYGHCDPVTGAPQVPSLDEMYMSDDELPPANFFLAPEGDPNTPIHAGCGNVPFEPHMWQPKHARKARWAALSAAERAMILDEEWRQVSRDFSMDGEQAVAVHAKGQIARAIHSLGLWQPVTPNTQRRVRSLVQDAALLAIADPDDGSDSPHLDDDADFTWHGEGKDDSYDDDDSYDQDYAPLPADDGEAAFFRIANLHNLSLYRVPVTPPPAAKFETLDEHLLNLADATGVQEDEYDAETGEWFDWEGHVEDVKADLVGEVQEEIREKKKKKKGKAKAKAKGKKVVRGRQDGEDADDEMEEDEEEDDERVKMLRGYYRMW